MNYSEQVDKTYFKNNKYVNKNNKSKRTEPVFNLKVSEKEKYANDGQWFKDYMDWVIPAEHVAIDSYDEMKLAYEVYNDNLSGYKKELDKFCNVFGENVNFIDDDIKPYPKLHNKVNVLKGELIKREDKFKAILLSAMAIRDKNKQRLEAIKASVEEEVRLEIEKVQMELQGKKPEEVQQYIESIREGLTPEDISQKNFSSDWEIFYNKGIKYCYFDQNIKSKKIETLEDVLVVDKCFIYSGWQHGKPHVEIRNPLYTFFEKESNQEFIHKGIYVGYRKPITIASAYNNYGQDLKDEDLEKLGVDSYSRNNIVDKRHALGPHKNQFVTDLVNQEIFNLLDEKTSSVIQDKRVGLHQGQGTSGRDANQSFIWETHFEFMAFRELYFVSNKDEYGDTITTTMPIDFEIPEDAEEMEFTNAYGHKNNKWVWTDPITQVEYTAERLWIPRKYEIIRLGQNIYPIYREVPYQSTSLDNPYSNFTLSTFGAIFTSRNAKSISPLMRALPAYFQYLYIKHIQVRELAKYQGYIQSVDVDQIPTKLGQDIDGRIISDPIATWMLYRKKAGVDFYSGSQTESGATPPSTRSPGSVGYILGTASEIFNLQQLLEYIDREIGMAMGISPQRESNFTQNSNVADNQQAITQSHHITEPYFFQLDQIWKDVITDYLKNFRTYCQMILQRTGKAPIFHYVLPDGTEELFEVTPKMLEMQDIGIYVSNSMNDERYYEHMLSLSQAFAQNAGEGIEIISSLIKTIVTGTSPEEVHKLLQVEIDKQSKRLQEQEQMKLKVQEEYKIREDQVREDQQAHEIEKIIVSEKEKRQTALEKAAIDLYKFTEDKNQDQDGIPDALETLELLRKMNESQTKLSQEDRKISLKEKELGIKKEIEEKKIKASAKKSASKN